MNWQVLTLMQDRMSLIDTEMFCPSARQRRWRSSVAASRASIFSTAWPEPEVFAVNRIILRCHRTIGVDLDECWKEIEERLWSQDAAGAVGPIVLMASKPSVLIAAVFGHHGRFWSHGQNLSCSFSVRRLVSRPGALCAIRRTQGRTVEHCALIRKEIAGRSTSLSVQIRPACQATVK